VVAGADGSRRLSDRRQSLPGETLGDTRGDTSSSSLASSATSAAARAVFSLGGFSLSGFSGRAGRSSGAASSSGAAAKDAALAGGSRGSRRSGGSSGDDPRTLVPRRLQAVWFVTFEVVLSLSASGCVQWYSAHYSP